jgi:hypothetical protein
MYLGIIFTENFKTIGIMKNLKKGKWNVDNTDSLIINLFDVTDKITDFQVLMSYIINKIKSNKIQNNRILVSCNGINLYFDVTIDSNKNFGLLFTGLK